jgi:hypothetical protein
MECVKGFRSSTERSVHLRHRRRLERSLFDVAADADDPAARAAQHPHLADRIVAIKELPRRRLAQDDDFLAVGAILDGEEPSLAQRDSESAVVLRRDVLETDGGAVVGRP